MTTVFSPWAVAAEPWYAVRLSYATDIYTAEDGTEQRRMLRIIPVREHSCLFRSIAAQSTGWLDALTYGNQTAQLAIPHWPHGTYLSSTASAGSNVTINVVDTTDRDFVAGGYAVIWKDEEHSEVVTITSKTATSIVVPTLVNSYTRPTFVMPAYRGRIKGDLSLSRFHASMAEAPVTITVEHQSDPSVSMPVEALVFSTVPYMRVDVSHDLSRQVDRLESLTYTYGEYPTRIAPIGTRPFRVWVNSRSAANSLIAWFQSVRGRFKSFYLPTYQDDLKVVSGLGTTAVTIQRCGYTTAMSSFPERKVLAAIQPNGTVTKCQVVSAVDNGSVTNTETLTLDVAPSASTSMLSYLLYGRLESDTLELKWQNNSRALCEMGFVECPAELAPTEDEFIPDEDNAGAPNQVVGPAVAAKCTANVPNGQDEVPTLITVTARDTNSLRVQTSGATVAGTVTGANTTSTTTTDLGNGTYRLTYTPHNTGTDSVAITYNASPISGSPFTSVVGTTPVSPPTAMPFGFYNRHSFSFYASNLLVLNVSTSSVIGTLAECFAAGAKLMLQFPRKEVKDSAGRFSLSRFQSYMDSMAAVGGINTYISNGTLAMHAILDDINAFNWGGVVPSISDLSAACAYSKSKWPTVPTAVTKYPTALLGMTDLDYASLTYLRHRGEVTAMRKANETAAQKIGCRLIMGLNTLHGGDGSSGIGGDIPGVTGTYYAMTGAEILSYGKVLAASPYADWFAIWRAPLSVSDRYTSYYQLTSVHNAVLELSAFCAGEVR